jgi:exopolyphosphatase/guanosine-5'-triphosphate,3'-diphosphate pyrophosphatase
VRERVALAEGLQADGSLSKEVEARALECLGRFGQRIAEIAPSRVRAVGTATLREMRSTRAFLEPAGRALGHEIEVLAGREEARLIYLGVAHAQGDDEGTRLVIDIGGGSTECILGRRFEATTLDSLSMGCIPWSARYFPRGALSRDAFEEAEIAARIEFETIEGAYREHGWRDCFGSSGTILAIDEMLTRAGWSEGGITERGLAKLEKAMIAAGKLEKLELEGLKPDRKSVLPGGLAILRAAFDALGIARMQASKGALREGLLYDLMGRIYHEDVRERTVRAFAARYRVDEEQAERVAKTALALFDGVARSWGLDPGARQALNWSAALHEVGLTVSYAGYHRHGAYLIANSDLPGFSRDDQDRLAALVQLQRGKLDEAILAALPSPRARAAMRLAVLLRRRPPPPQPPRPRPPDARAHRQPGHPAHAVPVRLLDASADEPTSRSSAPRSRESVSGSRSSEAALPRRAPLSLGGGRHASRAGMDTRESSDLADPTLHWVERLSGALDVYAESVSSRLSPYILMDYAGPVDFEPSRHARGVGSHPHRGFETVTIVYQGELEHRDSAGNSGSIGAGDVQWMTAASGVLHEEKHSRRFTARGGVLEMTQLWVNLRAKDKRSQPRYQTLLGAEIPTVTLSHEAGTVRLIAGDLDETRGAAKTHTPLFLWDVELGKGKEARLPVPDGYTLAVHVRSGSVHVAGTHTVAARTLAVLERSGADVLLRANDDAKLIVLGGEPIEEPVVAYGPFVMNTDAEIDLAIEDFQAGRLGRLD